VRWSRDGEHFAISTPDSTAFVRELFGRYGEAICELEVRRTSLEDAYLQLIRETTR
jgi:ABC-2 type transport system ATP-binding protein